MLPSNRMTLPTLDSTRIRLRTLTSDDASDVFAIFSDPDVVRYWSSPAMQSVDDACALIAEIDSCAASGELFQWGVVLLDDDRVIGTCTLAHINTKQGRAEVGFALAQRAWGRGVMREALSILIAHAFGSMNLRRLEADTDPRNERALRLLDGVGFRREGLLRERWFVAGETQDSVVLGLLSREWGDEGRCT